jgi:hypothetical protein
LLVQGLAGTVSCIRLQRQKRSVHCFVLMKHEE